MSATDSNTFKLNITAAAGGGPWVPPYPVPTVQGQVVRIGGAGGAYAWTGGGSAYPTNVWADVAPTEVGGATKKNEMLHTGDSGCNFSPHFSAAGCIFIAGSGGHHGTNIFGGGMFDFTDARWKYIWTTQGSPGVDNISGEGPPPAEGGPPYVNTGAGRRVHNLLNLEDDIHDIPKTATGGHYEDGVTTDRFLTKVISSHTPGAGHVFILESAFSPNHVVGGRIFVFNITGTAANALNNLSHTITAVSGAIITTSTNTAGLTASGGTANAKDPIAQWTGPCWNHEHWLTDTTFLGGGYPPPADPRNARWETTRFEPYPWSATQVSGTNPDGSGKTVSGPHGWKYPGDWPNGVQTDVTGRAPGFNGAVQGLCGNSTRHTPTVGLPIPNPGHVFNMYFSIPPSQGGGVRGSAAFMQSNYAGASSSSAVKWSWRFDWHTGQWSEWSVNICAQDPLVPRPAAGLGPWTLTGSVAGAYDPIKDRLFQIGYSKPGAEQRLNYLNMSDRRWRNMGWGTSAAPQPAMTDTNTGQCGSINVDPVRRLLIGTFGVAPHFRIFNLDTVGVTGNPEPTPSTGTGGWTYLPVTAAPGFVLDATNIAYRNPLNVGWHYYPPNGKYYRCIPNLHPKPSTGTAYNATGNFHFNVLHRLTPPPIIPNPPANWYVTQPWTYDQITVGASAMQPAGVLNHPAGTAVMLPRCPWNHQEENAAAGPQWFWYVPALQCFAYCPLDNGANHQVPAGLSRHCVYLIKPY